MNAPSAPSRPIGAGSAGAGSAGAGSARSESLTTQSHESSQHESSQRGACAPASRADLRVRLDALGPRLDGIQMARNLPLGPLTTYRVGGPADLAVFPRSGEQVARVVREVSALALPLQVLGLGSNVLVGDRGVPGVTLVLRDLDAIQVQGTEVVAGAGAHCSAVAEAAAEAGLTGLEFFYGLPGSVGGAAFMNARAFGQEVSQVWRHAVVVTRQGALREIALSCEDFRYKYSPLQDTGDLAVSVTLHLGSGDRQAVWERMRANMRHRKEAGEDRYPSCGCVFQNDRRFGAPSGRLIDQCGLKGYQVGGARVSEHHANFVVNVGGATAADIRAVMEHVRAEVARQTGHCMAYEVRFVGVF